MFLIERKFHFHAAHRNKELGGNCRFLHGHTYHLEIQFAVPKKDEYSGVTIEFKDLEARTGQILAEFDHSTIVCKTDETLLKAINILPEDERKIRLMNKPTSAENLAEEIFEALKNAGLKPVQLSLQETTTSKVIYTQY